MLKIQGLPSPWFPETPSSQQLLAEYAKEKVMPIFLDLFVVIVYRW